MSKITLKIFCLLLTLIFFFTSSVAPALAAITYTYDQNGNMVSDGTKCYSYNQANKLVRVRTCSNNQLIAEYVYDHEGKRLVKKEYESGTLKRTVYSPSDDYETVKIAPNGTTQNTTYYYANDQLIAKKNPDGTKNYYHNDHLGSTNVMTSQTGTLVEETKYDPWGEVKTGGTKSKFLFTGQEKDLETSLNYYNARYYDSHMRRFTQPDDIIQDPYNPQSLNRYSYVLNNPLKYTDPTGHFWWLINFIQSVATKIAGSPTAQKAVQNANKVQSNPGVQKTENNAGKIINNPTVNKVTSNTGNVSGKIPQVTNPKLNNIVQDFYRGVKNPNRVGSGTTADAIRFELRTGLEVFGREHSQKGQDIIRGIDKVLKDPKTSQSDIDVANLIKADLKNALKGIQ